MNTGEAIEILESIYPSQKQIATGEYPQVADALDYAISALRAHQERETECVWCKGDWTDNFSVLDEDFCQPLTYRHVKFCPMCGRKLEPKEATHDNP